LPPGIQVNAYVASQAAVSAQAYDNEVPHDADFRGILEGPSTPEVMAYYWDGARRLPSYFNGNAAKVSTGKIQRYFNEHDYALSKWEINNYLKPDDSLAYFYTGSSAEYSPPPQGSDRFYHVDLLPYNEKELLFEEDRYKIFAFCAESYSKALGATTGRTSSYVKVLGFNDFDLEHNELLSYDDLHYSHSREFRSNIVKEWMYWNKIKTDFGQ